MLELDRVTFQYEDMAMSFTLTVPGGSFAAVIGPSGAGKSTLLALIAGFEQALLGRIVVGGRDVTYEPPMSRPINMIFQDNNVFAHLDVWTNVALGVSPRLQLDALQKAQVDAALDRTGISALARRKPGEVSGGERQRVAIARALVREKPVLLLDEPFAALGPGLRTDMLDLLRGIQQERKVTVLMVTHQIEDATRAADHTVFISNGRILAHRPTADLLSSTDIPELVAYLGEWKPG